MKLDKGKTALMSGAPDIPTLVRAIRKARGLTQEQLARELGVTFSTVNGWENGKHRPLPLLTRMLFELGRQHGVAVEAEASAHRTKRKKHQ